MWRGNVSEYILEMKGVVKAFAGTLALDHVDFSLKQGEIMALIGENGAGKSTLMNVLMGVHHADEGTFVFKGQQIENRNPHEALQRGIGMVPQELSMLPELSVAENIFMASPAGKGSIVHWNELYCRAEKELAKLEVDIDPRCKVGSLSAAFQQLVSICRTLAMGSELIVLDEPTAALTTLEADRLFSVIRKLKADGKTMVIITHHLDEVELLADRVSVMRDGRMVKVDEVSNLTIDEMIFHMANERVEKQKKIKSKYSDEDILVIQDYSREHEFDHIHLNVKKGELLGIAGLVGSGRTELFNCVYGITPRQSGKLFFEGKEVNIDDPQKAIRLGIGYVPEERRNDGIFPVLSVYENMMLPSYEKNSKIGMIRFSRIKKIASAGIEKLRIKTPSSNALIKNLSGGNQQKVILARWIEKQVKLLILDEPTRGIDVRAKSEIYKIIKELADTGITMVVISSETEELLNVCDRIVVMFNGSIKGSLIPDENTTREDVLKIALQ